MDGWIGWIGIGLWLAGEAIKSGIEYYANKKFGVKR